MVGVVPEGAGHVIGRNVDLVVLAALGLHGEQHVVTVAEGGDVQAVGVQVGGVEAVEQVHHADGRGLGRQVIAQGDAQLVTRPGAQGGAYEASVVGAEKHGVLTDLVVRVGGHEGDLELAILGHEHLRLLKLGGGIARQGFAFGGFQHGFLPPLQHGHRLGQGDPFGAQLFQGLRIGTAGAAAVGGGTLGGGRRGLRRRGAREEG